MAAPLLLSWHLFQATPKYQILPAWGILILWIQSSCDRVALAYSSENRCATSKTNCSSTIPQENKTNDCRKIHILNVISLGQQAAEKTALVFSLQQPDKHPAQQDLKRRKPSDASHVGSDSTADDWKPLDRLQLVYSRISGKLYCPKSKKTQQV